MHCQKCDEYLGSAGEEKGFHARIEITGHSTSEVSVHLCVECDKKLRKELCVIRDKLVKLSDRGY